MKTEKEKIEEMTKEERLRKYVQQLAKMKLIKQQK